MTHNAENLFQQIGDEVQALRCAVRNNDLAAIELHTVKLRKGFEELRAVPAESRPRFFREMYILNGQVRSTLSVLKSARRTVRALLAVCNSFSVFTTATVTGQR